MRTLFITTTAAWVALRWFLGLLLWALPFPWATLWVTAPTMVTVGALLAAVRGHGQPRQWVSKTMAEAAISGCLSHWETGSLMLLTWRHLIWSLIPNPCCPLIPDHLLIWSYWKKSKSIILYREPGELSCTCKIHEFVHSFLLITVNYISTFWRIWWIGDGI